MKHLSIIIPEGPCNLMKIVGTREVFEIANYCYSAAGKTPVFQLQFVGCSPRHRFIAGALHIEPEITYHDLRKTDLIVIPAMDSGFEEALQLNAGLMDWITAQYKAGAQVASLCTGAFLLAATGLLNKRQCTTHWWATGLFRKMFPDIALVPEKIITEENGLFTSGGAFSSFNLLIYLVEKYYGRDTAISCAKVLEIDIDRSSQSPFIVFNGQKEHEDGMIREAQLFIEQHVQEKITVESLAAQYAVSKRNFERRFKKATHNTPVEYIQRVKIEAAKKALESGRRNVNEVMYDIGYADVKAFRILFKKITGLSPVEYRNKYSRAGY